MHISFVCMKVSREKFHKIMYDKISLIPSSISGLNRIINLTLRLMMMIYVCLSMEVSVHTTRTRYH